MPAVDGPWDTVQPRQSYNANKCSFRHSMASPDFALHGQGPVYRCCLYSHSAFYIYICIYISIYLSIYVYMIATCSQPHGINVQMFLISVQNWKSYFKELQTMECWDNFCIFTFSFNVGITSFHIWKKIAVLCLFVIELHGNREGRRRISSKGGNDSSVRSMVS